MFKKQLDNNTIFHHDVDADKSYIETVSDVEPLLEKNKKIINSHDGGYASENFNHVGSIDLVVLKDWCKRKGIGYEEAMGGNNQILLDFLQDPDNAAFRTHPTYFKKV